MITSVYQLASSIQRYTQIMADSWQIAIICYLCGMKQIEATPILDIVSRITALEADMDNVAYDQSVNFILDGITCYNKEAWRTFSCFPSYCNTDIHIEAELLHEQLQGELNHLTNIFATSDISTKDVLERLRNMTADFYMKMFSPYSATEEEVNEVIEQYQVQISIAKNLIKAFRVRKKFLHKTARAKEAEEKSRNVDLVHFRTIRLDIDGLKRLYKNLCSEMVISNTSEETFLYVFGGHTLPKTRIIRWEGSLSLLVALFDTVVRDYEVWKIASCCFEKMGKDGCYSMVDRNQLKTTKQRNQSSYKYTEYLEMIENFC